MSEVKKKRERLIIVLEVGQIIKTNGGDFEVKGLDTHDDDAICNLGSWQLVIPQKSADERLRAMLAPIKEQLDAVSEFATCVSQRGLNQSIDLASDMLNDLSSNLFRAAEVLKNKKKKS